VDPWLINSCKIYRLEQESLVPFKDSIYSTMHQGKIAETNTEMDAKDINIDNEKDANEKCNIVLLYFLILYFAKIFILINK